MESSIIFRAESELTWTGRSTSAAVDDDLNVACLQWLTCDDEERD